MNIYFEDIMLRAIEKKDLDMLLEMINDPDTENMTGGYSFPVSEHQQAKWFENLNNDKNELRTVIEAKDHGGIGIATLTDIDWKNRTAQMHIKITTSKDLRGKGYGTKASKAILKYAFENLNLNLVYADIIEYNIISQKMVEKAGLKKEGILRNRIYKAGKYHNFAVWSIERGEWLGIK